MDTVRIFHHHVHVRVLLLGLLQATILLAAAYAGAYIRFYGSESAFTDTPLEMLPQALVFAALIMLCMISLGLYQPRLRDGRLRILLRVFLSFALASIALAVVFYVFPGLYLGRGVMAVSGLIALVGLATTHVLFFDAIDQAAIRRRILFYGAGKNAASLLSKLRRKSDHRLFTLMGCVSLPDEGDAIDAHRLITLDKSLFEYAREHRIEEIVVAMDDRRKGFPTDDLLACRLAGVQITDMLNFYERHTGKIKCDLLQPSWIIFSDGFRQGMLRELFKRAIDLTAALVLLLLTWPFMLAAVLAILLESGGRGPVVYRQERAGQNGSVFSIIKLRSMRVDAEQAGQAQWAQVNDSRITRVGAVLRKYRLDELPQLFNVLKGEMSLVGPRPERPEFVERLGKCLPYYAVRHRVKPGITGWAQLCYPYGSSEEDSLEKLQYDLYYVKNGSLFLDLIILLGTAEVVLFRKGAR